MPVLVHRTQPISSHRCISLGENVSQKRPEDMSYKPPPRLLEDPVSPIDLNFIISEWTTTQDDLETIVDVLEYASSGEQRKPEGTLHSRQRATLA